MQKIYTIINIYKFFNLKNQIYLKTRKKNKDFLFKDFILNLILF